MKNSALKELFEVESRHGAFYTGGEIQWMEDGKKFLCQCNNEIQVLDNELGTVDYCFGNDPDIEVEDALQTFSADANGELAVTSHASSLFKLWNWKSGTLLKQWKNLHKGPVPRLALTNGGTLLASGGSDSSVRLWNIDHNTCTHSLYGGQGVCSVLTFDSTINTKLIFSSNDDTKIRAWDIQKGKLRLELSGHFSKVTSICFIKESNNLVSCGRDRVLILWDLTEKSSLRVIPAYESLEALVLLPETFTPPEQNIKLEEGIYVASAGERGIIRMWDMCSGVEIYTQNNSLVAKAAVEGGLAVAKLLFHKDSELLIVVSADHNIILHELKTMKCTKQYVGFSDEILDVVLFGPNESHLAVASNSMDVKVYDMSDMNCQLLRGHTDLVLALAKVPSNSLVLVSCGKDNSVRLWQMDPDTTVVELFAVATRHTAAVGAVAFNNIGLSFFATVGNDCCIKLWSLSLKKNSKKKLKLQTKKLELQEADDSVLNVKHTEIAHDSGINSVCISPNDKLIATGSQDKLAKLWSSEDLSLVGVMRGHKRGVWSVRFSPVDQILMTTSADCSLKLWSVSDLSCLKTMMSHDSSVLRAEFLSQGMQIISAGADGLLKLWNIKTNECISTFDGHSARIWSFAVSEDEKVIVSGGSDSFLIKWKDVTVEKKDEALNAKNEEVLKEQQLANLYKANKLVEALRFALQMDKPFKVLKIVRDLLKQNKNLLHEAIASLNSTQKQALLKFAVQWNCNSRNSIPAQIVVSSLLPQISDGSLLIPNFSSSLESLLPYTERHFKRLTQLTQDLQLLNYTIRLMGLDVKS